MCASHDDRALDTHIANTATQSPHPQRRRGGLYGPPVPGPTTGAPPEPTREHHKGTPLRTQSAIGAHFVKRLIPGHIPASFPTVGCARAAQTSLGWRIHRAFRGVCEPRRSGLWTAPKSESVDSKAHSRFVLRIFVFHVSPATAVGEG